MSGGVDSAVAAARAAEAGHDVTGVHLALSRNPASYRSGARGCCTIEDANDARRAADVIGIPFYVWDLSDRFHEDVVEDFMDEYAAGRTPNPCLRCNEKIKFAAVLDRALGLGFDAVATGHYAQLRTGRRRPRRDAPRRRPRQGPVLRPGRADAGAARALAVPARRLAQGRRCARRPRPAGCWSPTSRTATTSASSRTATTPAGCARSSGTGRPTTAGRSSTRRPVRSSAGTTAPTGSPSASARACGSGARRRTGGRGSCSTSSRSRARSWSAPATGWPWRVSPRSGRAGAGRRRPCCECTVQLRAHGDEHRAVVRVDGESVEVELLDPAYGIAPGQAVVVYDGTRVVGSATISATRRAA